MKKRVLAAIISASLTFSGCSDDVPKSIKDINRNITKVEDVVVNNEIRLAIDLKPTQGQTSANFFSFAADDILKILSKTMLYFPIQKQDEVRFTISSDLTDRYGNVHAEPIIQLVFESSEIKKINFKNSGFTSWDLLNLAKSSLYLHPAGKDIVIAYCNEESNMRFAGTFCRNSI